MKRSRRWIAVCLLAQFAPLLLGQNAVQTDAASSPDEARLRKIDERLNGLTSALEQTRGELAAATAEIQQLRIELEQARAGKTAEVPVESSAAKLAEEVARIREDQEVMQAQVKVHEQDKVRRPRAIAFGFKDLSSSMPLLIAARSMLRTFRISRCHTIVQRRIMPPAQASGKRF